MTFGRALSLRCSASIGGAGHFLMLGKPAEVASEIPGFLEEIGL